MSKQFENLYRKLNTAQREAVDAIEGPVMVIAGPGTGKTHILTLRIANILKRTDTPPDGILALTFTESGANTMRKRLADLVGSAAYRVRIHTFHGYCQDVINRFPDEFPRIIGGEAVSDIERVQILSDIIINGEWKHLKPFGNNLYYLHSVGGAISEMKRENVSPDNLIEYLAHEQSAFNAREDLYHEKGKHKGEMRGECQTIAKKLDRSYELATAYKMYEAELTTRHRYDFEDMIVEVVGAMKRDSQLLLRLQEESLYILADEHQDANAAQNALLELLSGFYDSPNLFVVGDEKQAIYRFQGATLENFLFFKKRFPSARLIPLTDSYRSGQEILDASHCLMNTKDAIVTPVPLVSKAEIVNATMEIREFSRIDMERRWVAQEVKKLIGEGIEPSEIAVLFRTNGEADAIAREMEKNGIAISIESNQNALNDVDVRKFLIFARAVVKSGDDDVMLQLLHVPYLKMDQIDVYRIARYAAYANEPIASVLKSAASLKKAGVDDTKSAQKIYGLLSRFAKMEGSVPQQLDEMLIVSGYLEFVLSGKRARDVLDMISGILRDAAVLAAADPDYSVAKFVEHVSLLEEHKISISKSGDALIREGSVRLMTAHKSKGMEFDYVFIINAVDGAWGGRTEKNIFLMPSAAARGSDEDERRLFYVALTRGRYGVFVGYARLGDSGSQKIRSRLIESIDPSLIHEVSVNLPDDTIAQYVDQKINNPSLGSKDIDYFRALFSEQGLSVTALNSYLSCPWKYFYNNLIRIPKSPNKHMAFGTAVHAALRRMFDALSQDKKVSAKQLLIWFGQYCERAPLARKERDEMRKRGEEYVGGWYDNWHEEWNTKTKNEYKITLEMPVMSNDIKLIRLRGDLDKLEFDTDYEVSVVDYKTGKPRSRNAMLGNTKDESATDYFRQLVFYKLLLELEGKYKMNRGIIDFLQPDAKGNYHKEEFEITYQDVEHLREEIRRVAVEIYNLSFWDSFCADSECESCALRKLMINNNQ